MNAISLKYKLSDNPIVKGKILTAKQYYYALKDYQNTLNKVNFMGVNKEIKFSDVKRYIVDNLDNKTTKYNYLINSLEKMNCYIATQVAGMAGEEKVKKSLGSIGRTIYPLSGITLDDRGERTEYDQILITENGILILEVKNYKNSFTINKEGVPVNDKGKKVGKNILTRMFQKRQILINKLIEKFKKENIDIPLNIDGYVVFTNSSVQYKNLAIGLKHIKISKLAETINAYSSNIKYTNEQMQLIERYIYEIGQEEYKVPDFDLKKITDDLISAIRYIDFQNFFINLKNFFINLFNFKKVS